MTFELIDRKQLKADMKALLATAEVCPKRMVALYFGVVLVLNLVVSLVNVEGILSTFVSILASLLDMVLCAGFALYCMAVRRGERAEYLTLFDGFSFAGKLIALNLVMYIFIWLWSALFVVPGIIAAYRYRFALYNLYENPGIGVMEALDMSKQQTYGYKGQLFSLDLSYLGWGLLAGIPAWVQSALLYHELLNTSLGYLNGTVQALPAQLSLYAALPSWGWTLLIGVWSLVVAMFYFSTMQCTELGYFEIAKRTSGVGANSAPRLPDSSDDNAGSF